MDFIVWMGVRLAMVSRSVVSTLCEVVNCVTIWLIVCNWLNCFCARDSLVFWLNCVTDWLFERGLGCICGIDWIGWQFGKLWEVRDILWCCVSCWVILELRVLSEFLGCCVYCLCCWIFWYSWYSLVFCDSFMPVWYSMRLVQFMVVFKLFWTRRKGCCGCTIFRTARYFRTNYMI